MYLNLIHMHYYFANLTVALRELLTYPVIVAASRNETFSRSTIVDAGLLSYLS